MSAAALRVVAAVALVAAAHAQFPPPPPTPTTPCEEWTPLGPIVDSNECQAFCLRYLGTQGSVFTPGDLPKCCCSLGSFQQCCQWRTPPKVPTTTTTTPGQTTTTTTTTPLAPTEKCPADVTFDSPVSCAKFCGSKQDRGYLRKPTPDAENGACCCLKGSTASPDFCCAITQPFTTTTAAPIPKPTGSCPASITDTGRSCYNYCLSKQSHYVQPPQPGTDGYPDGGCCCLGTSGSTPTCCALGKPVPVVPCNQFSDPAIVDEKTCSAFCASKNSKYTFQQTKDLPLGQCCCIASSSGVPSSRDACCNVVKSDDENPKDCSYNLHRYCFPPISLASNNCAGCQNEDDDDAPGTNNCVKCITAIMEDKALSKNQFDDPLKSCCPCVYQYAEAADKAWMEIEC